MTRVERSWFANETVTALSAVFDVAYASPLNLAYSKLGSLILASEPSPLETLTMRPAGACSRRRSIDCVPRLRCGDDGGGR
ncbi:MAG TPA: hypothetical protein VK841_07175 [Polyangiaceae bacterium]|nr:hypothetical protein [Polyangiaceae bacterium]